ncbi:hypothetical protein EBZ39_00815 [bacterium]|nr:hypothetical protein [bacterium]
MFKFIANLFKPAPVAATPIITKTPKRRMRRKRNYSTTAQLRKLTVGESFFFTTNRKRKSVSGGMLTILANEGRRYSQHRMKSGIRMTRVS